MKKFKKFFADNSLSVVLAILFLGFLIGQYCSGYVAYNEIRKMHHLPQITHMVYLGTGHFLDGIFVNWQAAILQLGTLITLSIILVQKGATHSKKPNRKGKNGNNYYHGISDFIRKNSLSLAFGILFFISFFLHLYFSYRQNNYTRLMAHATPDSLGNYVLSANFWFLTFQTWQAEYMAIAIYLVLSIFLRQEGSPESKPTNAGNHETGEANN